MLFSQHQDTELELRAPCLGADQKARGLWKRDWTPCKPRHACAVEPEVLKSWTLEIDYSRASRAPCLVADQKTRGLWERDWARAVVKNGSEVEYK